MEPSSLTHVMLVSFPGQGHINPLLRLGKLIASKGFLVTFVTTEQPWGKKMRQASNIQSGLLKPIGLGFLRFEFFSDGLPEDDKTRTDFDTFLPHLEAVGKQEIKNLVKRYDKVHKEPVMCLINNAFVPWVCDVAEELQISSAVLWVQSCACLAAYYYYHHRLVKFPTEKEPEINVEIPYLPLLKYNGIPSFLLPSSPLRAFGEVVLDQFKRLGKDKSLYLFIDTFQELEKEIINHMSELCPKAIISPIGPLFKMAQTISSEPVQRVGDLNSKEHPKTLDHCSISSDVKADISQATSDCIEWLDSKEPSSVVYISFGTIVYLKQEQMEELAYGVLSSGLTFLWVVRPPMQGFDQEPHVLPQELEEKGKIVEWCNQEKVLSHPSIACFLSHCGWNSTMEALTSGIPVVCFPQWGDQVTDAVYLIDVFKTGVRLGYGDVEGEIVLRDVVAEKLLEATVGEKAVELRENARRWKEKAGPFRSIGELGDRLGHHSFEGIFYGIQKHWSGPGRRRKQPWRTVDHLRRNLMSLWRSWLRNMW